MKTTPGLLLTGSIRVRQTRIRNTGQGAGLIALIVLVGATTGASSSPSVSRVRQNGRHQTIVLPSRSTTTDCSTDSTLCLTEGRFLVEAAWKAPDGSSGQGHPVRLTPDSGYFWFLQPNNIELAVETLKGCRLNGHTWFFSGGRTNLEITISVFDTTTGETKTYFNAQGNPFRPILDTEAFESCTAGADDPASGNRWEPPGATQTESAPALAATRPVFASGCVESNTVLCVGGRFQVEANWQTASGASGPAYAVPVSSESGYFWFLEPSNVEVFVKTLDACVLGKGHLVFVAGSTNLGVDLRITDTFTGDVRTYSNPPGSPFIPVQDMSAFSFCHDNTILNSDSSHAVTATRAPASTLAPSENHAPKPTHSPRPPNLTATPTPTAIQTATRTPRPKPRHTPTPTPTPTSTPGPPTATPTASLTPTQTPTPGPPQTYTVAIGCNFSTSCSGGLLRKFAFSPNTIRIHIGDTINWRWGVGFCGGVHSITSGTLSAPDGKFNSGTQSGPTFSHTFTQTGTYPYFCNPGHFQMVRTCSSCCVPMIVHETGTVIVDP